MPRDDTPQIADSRARRHRRLDERELIAGLGMAGAFLAVAIPLALLLPTARDPSLVLVAALVVTYALLSRIHFEAGPGIGVPTQLVLLPMLFQLPLGWVPLAVTAGALLGEVRGHGSRSRRLLLALGSSWFAVGPVLVLIATVGEAAPQVAHAWAYLLALVAQVGFDLAAGVVPDIVIHRIRPRLAVRPLLWVYAIDAMLTPVAFALAVSSEHSPYVFLASLALGLLLVVFARERSQRIDQALELSKAYRRTALLLGDVIDADDGYTGIHSRGVVGLARAVAEEFALDDTALQETEFAALLHDIGKIRIPKEILNKRGPLTPAEWEVMRTHPALGSEMLERVGGVLARVGRVVRSHHERWDGDGYPDRLAGEAIPLIARIVAVCDTFSAITTDRPYRGARSVDEAVAEIRRCSGSQFDPAVVAALIRAIEADRAAQPALAAPEPTSDDRAA